MADERSESQKPGSLPPPLKQGEDDTELDGKRALWASDRWDRQDAAYRLRDRDIEENVRMVMGQQWWVYHHLLGWHDISYWMSDDEKRWRQRPVLNRLLPWFVLTHARMTENPFICTFLPGPDHHDVELAELYDIMYKLKWREAGMVDVWARTAAWMAVAGTGYTQSRVDITKGERVPQVGMAALHVVGPDGQPMYDAANQPVLRTVSGVPFDKDYNPVVQLHHDGQFSQIPGMKPHFERRGDLALDVFSPLEVRGQWGPLPWHQQRVHMTRSYMTPQEVYERWGVTVKPDITDLPSGSAGFLERLLFGSGFYGAAANPISPEVVGASTATEADGYAMVQSMWIAPYVSEHDEDEGKTEYGDSLDQPGGRLLITTKDKVLRDGPRPFYCKWTSPIRAYEFLRIPGRPWGSTPLEMMKSPQKAYNSGYKQILENRALASNPQQVYDLDSGLRADQINNRPGQQYGVRMKQGVKPIDWIVPPPMGSDVWRTQSALAQELTYLGSQSGLDQSQNLGKKASGELVRELRFNDDRLLGPTMRRVAEEMGRMIEDWRSIFAVIYDEQTILRYTGDDGAARTMLLMPELLKTGDVTVVPDTESMLPEGRGERRNKVWLMWQAGAFGDPKSDAARRQLLDLGRFPNMALTAAPGGIHRATARQEHAEMLANQMPELYQWQDHAVHLYEHEEFMSSSQWKRLPEETKAIFVQHRQQHRLAIVMKKREDMMLAMAANPMAGAGGPAGGPGGEEPAAGGPPRRPQLVRGGQPQRPPHGVQPPAMAGA